MKLAVVDLGTNTCRLLLAEVQDGAFVRREVRETHVVRLATYAARIAAYTPDRRLLVATSVLRDATDGAAFLTGITRDFGLPHRVIGGEEEARLAFRGVTAWLAGEDARRTADAEVAVVDIGGGSTEFAVGRPGLPPRFVRSLDMGAVRLTERFFAADPPTGAQWHDAVRFVDGLLRAGIPPGVRASAGVFVGVAGTFTTLVAHELGMRVYEPERVHGRTLTAVQIDRAIDLFRGLTSAQRGALPGIQKGREDVILAGALIARAACRAFGAQAALVSEDDILEGVALWLADGLPALTPARTPEPPTAPSTVPPAMPRA